MALARTASSRHAFFTQVMRIVARAFASPYAVILVRHESQVTQDDCHSGSGDPGFWKDDLKQFLTEVLSTGKGQVKLLNPKQDPAEAALLAAPIVDAGSGAVGAIGLVVTRLGRAEASNRLAWLESLAGLASLAAETVGRTDPQPPASVTTAAVPALGMASQVGKPEELAFAVTNNLRNKLGCEQVAMGMVDRGRVRMLSISGLDHVVRQSTGVRCLQSAMEECLDAGAPIVCQDQSTWSSDQPTSGYRLHKQWRAAAKGDVVASIPLRAGERVVAVLSLRRQSDQPLSNEQIDKVRVSGEPFAAARNRYGAQRRGSTDQAGSARPQSGRRRRCRRCGVVFLRIAGLSPDCPLRGGSGAGTAHHRAV
jgi:hypothetical protein